MPWHIATVFGYEHQAAFYLRRNGLRCFYPVEHVYDREDRSKNPKFKTRALWKGYMLVEVNDDNERAIALMTPHVTGFLGWRTADGFRLAAIPKQYVTTMMDAKPQQIDRYRARACNQGQKVKIALGKLAHVIGIFQRLDGDDHCVVKVDTLGKPCEVKVELNRLEAAE